MTNTAIIVSTPTRIFFEIEENGETKQTEVLPEDYQVAGEYEENEWGIRKKIQNCHC